ncbi:MAG: PKD domain-containing protein [Nanoarchaeota archaeon]
MQKRVMFVLILVFLSSIIYADFQEGEKPYSITTKYSANDNLKGWVNISLNNEPANARIETEFGNIKAESVSLIDLLNSANLTKDKNYTCSISDCGTEYAGVGESSSTSKVFNMKKSENNISGFLFNEELTGITSVVFSINSNAITSCNNQLKIDFFDDGEIDFANKNVFVGTLPADEVCSAKDYGCFNPYADATERDISSNMTYCQKILIPESSGARVGAVVMGNGDKELKMSVYKSDGSYIGECIENVNAGNNWEQISCDVNEYLNGGNYYVCINGDERENIYKIKLETNDKCGFFGSPENNPEETAAYQIFAQGKKFAAVGSLSTSGIGGFDESSFADKVKNYIEGKYGSLDCSGGCSIPIKLIAGEDEEVTLSGLNINYDDQFGPVTNYNLFNDFSTESAKINSGFVKIKIDKANLHVPSSFGSHNFLLTLGGKEIISEKIEVQRTPTISYVTPWIAVAAFPTEFTVFVDKHGANTTITQYKWGFGDGSNETTTNSNKAEHTYNNQGNFQLRVTIKDSKGIDSSKSFNITVGTAKNSVEMVLQQKINNLNNIEKQIKNLSAFEQTTLKNLLSLDEAKSEISGIQRRVQAATIDNDYVGIMQDLTKTTIPESIVETVKADSIIFIPDKNNINLDIIKEAGGGNYNNSVKTDYINSIITWDGSNLETKVDFNEISGLFNGELSKIVSFITVKTAKENLDDIVFLFIPNLGNLTFKENYSKTEREGYTYIELKEMQNTIEFHTKESIDFQNMPIFLSPRLSQLSVQQSARGEEIDLGKTSKQIFFVLSIILLAMLGFIVYIIMQEWYKRRYETYLFKNKNDLYNMVSYIHNAKKRGINHREISSKLKRAGWNSEQVNYIVRKYLGKRTGMFEIPVNKIINFFRKKEVDQRNQFQTRPPRNINTKV